MLRLVSAKVSVESSQIGAGINRNLDVPQPMQAWCANRPQYPKFGISQRSTSATVWPVRVA